MASTDNPPRALLPGPALVVPAAVDPAPPAVAPAHGGTTPEPDTFAWEDVYDDLSDHMERGRVPGGWLYRNTRHAESSDGDWQMAVALAFVPDPQSDGDPGEPA